MPNRLLNAKLERLVMASEEGAEIVTITSKIVRHGPDSFHPNDPAQTPNIEMLRQECIDVLAMIQVLLNHEDIAPITASEINQRMADKLKYTHHQEETERWNILTTALSINPGQ